MASKIRVGYVNPSYSLVRCVLNKCQDVDYVRIRPWRALRAKLARHHVPFLRSSQDEMYVFDGGMTWPPFRKYDLCHFFNDVSICLRGKPFITTFEQTVPRSVMPNSDLWKRCVESMLSNRCRRLIGFSDCARLQMELYCRQYGIEDIEKKLTCILPPQEQILSHEDVERRLNRGEHEIRFAFVGRNFWRKGGCEIVRALCRVRKHYPIRLFLVGDLFDKDFFDCDSRDSAEEIGKMIEQNRTWIDYHVSMKNREVLENFKSCDVGLLPTRGDTFGYSVLEMQACGLPCITTDIWSLPEINDDAHGWLIHVPKGANRQADVMTFGVERISEMIEDQLYSICMAIAGNPACISSKSLASLRQIAEAHAPAETGRRLKCIYEESIDTSHRS